MIFENVTGRLWPCHVPSGPEILGPFCQALQYGSTPYSLRVDAMDARKINAEAVSILGSFDQFQLLRRWSQPCADDARILTPIILQLH